MQEESQRSTTNRHCSCCVSGCHMHAHTSQYSFFLKKTRLVPVRCNEN
uniref:Uncharacterized protein n=1 Tax=Arundo donax TaxID=35708 RepID=A0A0A9HDV9_ARUDO